MIMRSAPAFAGAAQNMEVMCLSVHTRGEYAIYLRKSRSDLELEASGSGDTLERHRRTLLELAASRNLTVTQIYEEVVSGETISARPEMQRLLSDVDQGVFAGAILSGVRVSYYKLWDGDELLQDMIPVRVGQVGYLYDRVSGNFFGNVAGSGAFVLGNDIT